MFKTSWSSTKTPQFTKESGNAQKEGNSKLDLDTVNDTFLSVKEMAYYPALTFHQPKAVKILRQYLRPTTMLCYPFPPDAYSYPW